MSTSAARAVINLKALCANYAYLMEKGGGTQTAAVVKANAYGLGSVPVTQALAAKGCVNFFVASIDEAIELKFAAPNPFIGVFYGVNNREDAAETYTHGLIPVLNSMAQIAVWRGYAVEKGQELPCIIHMDTGMTRVGISQEEMKELADNQGLLAGLDVHYFMSHLACAEVPKHPQNAAQLTRFQANRTLFAHKKFTFANSSGIFLGPDYHADLLRPGMALYGLNPTPDYANPMQTVVTLEAPLLQVRTLTQDEHVGYGATYLAKKGSRLATAAIGYADGLVRSLSNRGKAHINGYNVPIAGIVSMDLTILDVSSMPEEAIQPGVMAEFYGHNLAADDVAEQAGTIGYELFTSIAKRVQRIYI